MSEVYQSLGEHFRVDGSKKPVPEFSVSNDDFRQYLKSLNKPERPRLEQFDPVPPAAEKMELTKKSDPKFHPLILKEPEEKPCVLGLWPGEGNKIVFSGKGCEYHIVPMSPIEREVQRKLLEYRQTPAYKQEQEQHLRWLKKHIMD